jgi:hypothetical protein
VCEFVFLYSRKFELKKGDGLGEGWCIIEYERYSKAVGIVQAEQGLISVDGLHVIVNHVLCESEVDSIDGGLWFPVDSEVEGISEFSAAALFVGKSMGFKSPTHDEISCIELYTPQTVHMDTLIPGVYSLVLIVDENSPTTEIAMGLSPYLGMEVPKVYDPQNPEWIEVV